MAQGSSVFPDSLCGCLSLVVEPAGARGGPQLCPVFSGVPAPCPLCPARGPLVSPEVPCPGALPQKQAWGAWTSSPGLLCLLQAAFKAFWAHGPGPAFPLFGFTDSPLRLLLSSPWALTPGRSHGLVLTHLGSQVPWPLLQWQALRITFYFASLWAACCRCRPRDPKAIP